jgi:hypothetical protein
MARIIHAICPFALKKAIQPLHLSAVPAQAGELLNCNTKEYRNYSATDLRGSSLIFFVLLYKFSHKNYNIPLPL